MSTLGMLTAAVNRTLLRGASSPAYTKRAHERKTLRAASILEFSLHTPFFTSLPNDFPVEVHYTVSGASQVVSKCPT